MDKTQVFGACLAAYRSADNAHLPTKTLMRGQPSLDYKFPACKVGGLGHSSPSPSFWPNDACCMG